ncbi:hypothetical protein EGR_10915 [Echinococcus granulosus]|uniref:Uncharacterized protein n=1 Tax=Echinococcus granulosus TaxID=6210 RepID=W6UL44_ECHGR|nr:hypothetical protein EGR_10915 [Echinococcus granulosus]EUB54224.1 hypothetical protein EGR_10915 [Echinococcus granulosus]
MTTFVVFLLVSLPCFAFVGNARTVEVVKDEDDGKVDQASASGVSGMEEGKNEYEEAIGGSDGGGGGRGGRGGDSGRSDGRVCDGGRGGDGRGGNGGGSSGRDEGIASRGRGVDENRHQSGTSDNGTNENPHPTISSAVFNSSFFPTCLNTVFLLLFHYI